MTELVIRLVVSLAVVLGLLTLLMRFTSKKMSGSTDAIVRILHRQPITRTSSVAVIAIGSRTLVVGSTEQRLELLAELEPGDLETDTTVVPMKLSVAPEPLALAAATQHTPLSQHVSASSSVADRPVAASAVSQAARRRAAPATLEPSFAEQLRQALDDDESIAPSSSAAPALPATGGSHAARAKRAKPGRRVAVTPQRAARPARAATPAGTGALAGSLLSPGTWKQALAATRGQRAAS